MRYSVSFSAVLPAIETVVAVEETNPPMTPVSAMPRSGPKKRPSRYAANPRPLTKTTISQTNRGLRP